MFTGIIESTGRLLSRRPQGQGARLEIQPLQAFDQLILGESIAVDGVCLTVAAIRDTIFYADCSKTSLEKTKLGSVPTGSLFNLERAMAANGRFGGHMVSGHVDETGRVLQKTVHPDRTEMTIGFSPTFRPYLVPQGSVTVDGVSLTVVDLTDASFDLVLIPHSLQETTLMDLQVQDPVHIEYDALGKYVVQWLDRHMGAKPPNPESDLLAALQNNGFL